MSRSPDPRVDAWIEALPDWRADTCRRLRALIHEADPEIEETIKYRDRPYFTLQGNVCALLAARAHVNMFLYDPIAPDPEGVITDGHDNATARQISIREGEPINERAIVDLLRAIVANNRAGGWRRLTREG